MNAPSHFRGPVPLTTLVRWAGRGFELEPDDGADEEGQRSPVFVTTAATYWRALRPYQVQAEKTEIVEGSAALQALRGKEQEDEEQRHRRAMAAIERRKAREEQGRRERERAVAWKRDREERRAADQAAHAAGERLLEQRRQAGRLGGLASAGRVVPRVVCPACGRTVAGKASPDGLRPRRHLSLWEPCVGGAPDSLKRILDGHASDG